MHESVYKQSRSKYQSKLIFCWENCLNFISNKVDRARHKIRIQITIQVHYNTMVGIISFLILLSI